MIAAALNFVSAWIWSVIGLMAMAACLVIGGCQYGAQQVQARWDAEKTATAIQAAHTEVAQVQATTQVITKYVDRIHVVRQRASDIIKEVPIYVSASADPTSPACALPGAWRVLHDAAAQGLLPDPARRADAPAVTAQDVATTVADNYGACHEVSEQLAALQQWLRDQQAVSAKQTEEVGW